MTQTLMTGCGQPCGVLPAARKELRYSITAKVWFNWQAEDGRWLEGEGITRDMSGNGLFVLTDAIPAAGASIVVIVVMPPLKMLQRPAAFDGYGKVVRIESVGGLFGFAAAVTFDSKNNYCCRDEGRRQDGLATRASPVSDRHYRKFEA